MSDGNFNADEALGPGAAIPLAEAPALVGRTLFVTDWYRLDEAKVRQFRAGTDAVPETADMTACLANPVGDENVDGFYLLSLLFPMHANHNPLHTVGTYALNYGIEKCRFPAPAFLTNRVRCVAVLEAAEQHPKGWLLTMRNTLLLEGSHRPAMTCSWKVLFVVAA